MIQWIRICLTAWLLLVAVGHVDAVELRGEDLSEALRAALEDELEDGQPAETRFEALRQAEQAAEKATDYLNSEGYFAADVEADVEGEAGFQSVLTITPGPRFRIGEIVIEYSDGQLSDEIRSDIRQALALKEGQVALPREIVAAERRLLVAAWNAGYADADTLPRDVLGDRQSGTIDLTLSLSLGPKVNLGQVIYETDPEVRLRFLERIVPFDPGEGYTPGKLDTFSQRLGETRLYDVFAVRLADGGDDETETGTRDVLVTVTPRDRYSIALGGSFSTTEGPGANAELLVRNFTGRGDFLRVPVILAELEQSIGANWEVPHALGFGRNANVNALLAREDTDAFDRTSVLLGTGIAINRGNGWIFGTGLSGEYSRETDTLEQRDLFILSGSGTVAADKTDDFLDPTRGWRAELDLTPVASFGDENSTFLSSVASGSYYQKLDPDARFILAGRIRAGAIVGAETANLPVGRRFFAGGGGSARGFGFQEVGPLDADGVPVGGRGLFEASGELRWRFLQNIGAAFFVDGASLSDEVGPRFEDFRVGVGAGLRYYTPIGPIRLDLATPLDRQEGEDAVQVVISIGQAF